MKKLLLIIPILLLSGCKIAYLPPVQDSCYEITQGPMGDRFCGKNMEVICGSKGRFRSPSAEDIVLCERYFEFKYPPQN